jgi:hypothetical protein
MMRFDTPRDKAESDGCCPKRTIVVGWAVRRDNFASAKRLRWVHLTAAGVGHMLFPEMVASDVVLTNARGLHAISMSEHALRRAADAGAQAPSRARRAAAPDLGAGDAVVRSAALRTAFAARRSAWSVGAVGGAIASGPAPSHARDRGAQASGSGSRTGA